MAATLLASVRGFFAKTTGHPASRSGSESVDAIVRGPLCQVECAIDNRGVMKVRATTATKGKDGRWTQEVVHEWASKALVAEGQTVDFLPEQAAQYEAIKAKERHVPTQMPWEIQADKDAQAKKAAEATLAAQATKAPAKPKKGAKPAASQAAQELTSQAAASKPRQDASVVAALASNPTALAAYLAACQ